MDANAPYLPPPEPTDNTLPKKSALRTLVLWLVLICMFIAIYQLFGSSPPQHATAARDCSGCSSPLWASISLYAVLGRRSCSSSS